MSELNEGFDLEKCEYTDYTEYASALEGENLPSTDCDMESESIWKPARRVLVQFLITLNSNE
jgi:hypothetical protein